MHFLSSVDDHVVLKVSLLCESLPALIACERFLSSVDPHVSPKTVFVCENLSTLSAGETFLVSILFSKEIRSGCEQFFL